MKLRTCSSVFSTQAPDLSYMNMGVERGQNSRRLWGDFVSGGERGEVREEGGERGVLSGGGEALRGRRDIQLTAHATW